MSITTSLHIGSAFMYVLCRHKLSRLQRRSWLGEFVGLDSPDAATISVTCEIFTHPIRKSARKKILRWKVLKYSTVVVSWVSRYMKMLSPDSPPKFGCRSTKVSGDAPARKRRRNDGPLRFRFIRRVDKYSSPQNYTTGDRAAKPAGTHRQ